MHDAHSRARRLLSGSAEKLSLSVTAATHTYGSTAVRGAPNRTQPSAISSCASPLRRAVVLLAVYMHVCMYVYDLALACMYGIAS
jgi:hypothetical protein